MPKNTKQPGDVPASVKLALQALEILRNEDSGQATAIEKILPGYAHKLEKSGAEVTVETLLKAGRQGPEYLKHDDRNGSPQKENALEAYKRIIAGMSPQRFHHRHSASEKRTLEKVKNLVEQGADERDLRFELFKAAGEGSVEVLRFLIAQGADVTAGDNLAIITAARQGHMDIVRVLVENGVEASVACNMPVIAVIAGGHIDMVRWLIENGADVAAGDSEAVMVAAARGHIDIVKLLIENGANVTAQSNRAIIEASRSGHTDIVKLLIENGADVSAQNNSPAKVALVNDHIDTVHLLVTQGADRSFMGIARFTTIRADVLEVYDRRQAVWQKVLHMPPPKGVHEENPAYFKKTCFEAVVSMLAEEGCTGNAANVMAFRAAALFQSEQRVLQYLERWGRAGRQPLHDLMYMIKLPEAGAPNLKDWGDAVLKCGPSMAQLLKFSDRIPSPLKSDDGRTWSMVNTRAECAKHSFYRAAEHPALAALCFEHRVAEDDFIEALELVKKGPSTVKTVPEITIAGQKFDMEGGKFYRLPVNDIRGLFLGEATDCCQSIGNTGGPCAEHGYTSPDGGFFVVENAKGRIVAQTWAWRGENGEMCFDSLETLGNNVTAEQWKKILQEAAKDLTARKDHDVSALHIGTGGNTPDKALRKAFKKSATAHPRDYSGYRDSKGAQIVVWQR